METVQAARLEEATDAGGGDALAERGGHASGHKDILRHGSGPPGVFPMLSEVAPRGKSGVGRPKEASMEFVDVVMKRRAVRRFEDGGVDREVIERIARLAQRTPSAGFSQGQRLVVVTDPGAPPRGRPDLRRGGVRARLRAVDQRVRRAVHPVRERGDLPPPLPGAGQGRGRRPRDRVAGAVLVGRHRRDDAEHHAGRGRTRASAAGSSGRTSSRCAPYLGIPDEFTPIGVMPVGRPLPDVRSPSLKRGWVPFEQFARWERWG